MKKFICCSLAILLVLSMFAGCGKEEAPVRDVPVKDFEAPAAEAASEAPAAPPRVEMSTTDLAEYVQKRTVTISVGLSNGTGTGSGFFIDDQGTVVTCYHVIDAAESIEVLCTVDSAKWEDTELFRFFRSTGSVGELYIRDFHSKMRDIKCERGFCVTAGSFTDEAHKYVEGRPIDLIEKNKLVAVLKRIDVGN